MIKQKTAAVDLELTNVYQWEDLIKSKIQELAENCPKTILVLSCRDPYVRSIDITNELSFSKPSVSVAMENPCEDGYILMDDQGHITLSSIGKEAAGTIYERHTMLSQRLMYLGVDEQTAVEDAYRIEHVVSAENSRAIKDHITNEHGPPEYNV